MTFSLALFVKIKLRGHNENPRQYNVVLYKETIINLQYASARRKKNDNIVYFTLGSRNHGGKIINSRFKNICFMICVYHNWLTVSL